MGLGSNTMNAGLKIVLNMTLGTNQRTHFVAGGFTPILTLTLEGFIQRKTGDRQAEVVFLIMTVGTTDGVHLAVMRRAIVMKFRFPEIIAKGVHIVRNCVGFTVQTGSRQTSFFTVTVDPVNLEHVINGVGMATSTVILIAERIAEPQVFQVRLAMLEPLG